MKKQSMFRAHNLSLYNDHLHEIACVSVVFINFVITLVVLSIDVKASRQQLSQNIKIKS